MSQVYPQIQCADAGYVTFVSVSSLSWV